jgi:histidinol-phosphatase
MIQSAYLKTALQAALQAEKVILGYYAKQPRVSLKPNRSPVTQADKEAEQLIRKVLKAAFPDHTLMGEEYGEDKQKSEFTWVIDPIDGTKNFTRKLPYFTTEILLMKGRRIILGVSNAPILSSLGYGERGRGAYINHKRVRVSPISDLSQAYVSLGGVKYFDQTHRDRQMFALVNKAYAYRSFGDAAAYHWLAQGKLDVIVEASVKIWDVGAVALIVEEAGGKVTDLDGKPLGLESTSILATNGAFHNSVLDIFQQNR